MPFDGKLDPVTLLLIEGREAIGRGWTQRATERDGAVCVMGALGWPEGAIGNASAFSEAVKRLAKAINTHEIIAWNDHLDRTKEEVLAAFDRAICAS